MSSMARIAFLIVLALICGILGGATWQQRRLEPQLAEAREDASTLERGLKKAQSEREEAVERLRNTDEDIEELNRYVASLEESLGDFPAIDSFEDVGEFEVPEEATAVAVQPPNRAQAAARLERRDWQRAREEWQDPEARERRSEAANRRRNRVQLILDETLLGATSAASQERLDALADYREYQNDLRGQLLSVDSDDERDALRMELRTAQQDARALIREEQNDRFREFAQSIGVESAREQDAIVRSVRQVLAEPIFSMEQLFTGSGGFGRGPRGGSGSTRTR